MLSLGLATTSLKAALTTAGAVADGGRTALGQAPGEVIRNTATASSARRPVTGQVRTRIAEHGSTTPGGWIDRGSGTHPRARAGRASASTLVGLAVAVDLEGRRSSPGFFFVQERRAGHRRPAQLLCRRCSTSTSPTFRPAFVGRGVRVDLGDLQVVGLPVERHAQVGRRRRGRCRRSRRPTPRPWPAGPRSPGRC